MSASVVVTRSVMHSPRARRFRAGARRQRELVLVVAALLLGAGCETSLAYVGGWCAGTVLGCCCANTCGTALGTVPDDEAGTSAALRDTDVSSPEAPLPTAREQAF